MDNNSQFNPIVVVKDSDKKPAFFKRIQAPFSKLSLPSNMNKKFAGALVALLLVFGVGVGAFLVQRQTQLTPRASENGVDLKIEPAAINASLNQEFSVDVVLDAKQASASAAQVKVTYDSQKLQLVTTTLGSFMPVALQQPINSAGAVEFVVGTSTPQGGSGAVATLRFKALIDLTTTTISIDPANTIVTVVNMNENQAGDITPATVTIGAVTGSPSPGTETSGFSPDPDGTLVNGLRAYWKMEEASGNLVDVISSIALSPVETISYNLTGKVNKAVGTTGAGKFQCTDTVCGGAAKLEPASTTGISFGGWVYPTAYATTQTYIVGKAAVNNEKTGYWLMYGPSGNVRVEMGNSSCTNDSAIGFQTAINAPLNQWTHLMATVTAQNPGIVKIYKNGALAYTSPASAYYCDTDGAFSIGGSNAPTLSANHNQVVDEIGVWARPLTAAEITNLYNGGNGNTYQSAVSTNPETSLKMNTVAPVTVGQEFNVPVYARSDIENSNVFAAKINFPANLLEVVSVNDDSSFITSWVEQFYDNQTGQLSLVGGVPNPGYKTNNSDAVMAIVRFKAKAAGTALIDMTSQSQIFSNATNQNILQKTQDVSFTISGGTGASPSPVSCQSNSQCPTGYYCQAGTAVCQDQPGGQCTIFGTCLPNSSKPSPSIAPEVSPSPSAGASASPNCATLKGDGNADCVVNLTDLSIMLSNFSATNPVPAGKQLLDFNNDNRINTFDFSRMADKLFELGVIKRRS